MATWNCTPEWLARQRERRKATGNASTKRYEKTQRGFLMRAYRNILGRITGLQPRGRDRYTGLPAMSKQEFYDWALADPDFHGLWDAWVAAGYERRLTPSVDRIDSQQGYVPGNVRWLTMSENSGRMHTVEITINGVTKTTREWSALMGVPVDAINRRLRAGWKPALAVAAPVARGAITRWNRPAIEAQGDDAR